MNVSGIGITANQMFDTWTLSMGGSQKKTDFNADNSIKLGSEDSLIEHFKEDNNPVAKKIENIMAKFKGGQELTSEEMEYLAKNAPDCYQQVIKILMERKQLEIQMEAAKSKMEVLQVYTQSLAMVKATKGTGAAEKQQASTTMMRLNHLQNAFGKFVKTTQYRNLEDESDRAEEVREKVEEQGLTQEELAADEAPSEVTADGTPPDELPADGTPPDELPANGMPPDKLPANGTPINELPEAGTPVKDTSTTPNRDKADSPKADHKKVDHKEVDHKENPFMQAKVSFSDSDVEFRKKVYGLYKGNMKNKHIGSVGSGIIV